MLEHILRNRPQTNEPDTLELFTLRFTNVGTDEIDIRGISPDGDIMFETQIPVSESIDVDYFSHPKVILSSQTRSVTVDIANIPNLKSAGCSPLATVKTLCADNKRIRAPMSLTLQDLGPSENESNGADASYILLKDAVAAGQFDNGIMLALNLTSKGSMLKWEIVLISVTLGIISFFALHCSSCTIINLLYRTSDPLTAHHGMGTLDKNETSHLFTEVDSYNSGPYE